LKIKSASNLNTHKHSNNYSNKEGNNDSIKDSNILKLKPIIDSTIINGTNTNGTNSPIRIITKLFNSTGGNKDSKLFIDKDIDKDIDNGNNNGNNIKSPSRVFMGNNEEDTEEDEDGEEDDEFDHSSKPLIDTKLQGIVLSI
jgi:hypothetical protein